MLRLDAGLAAAAAGAGAARFKLFDDVLHGPSKLQHTTRMLTVGALGNDMAPPGVPALAAASSAASLTSKRKMSSSPVPLCSCPPALSFMSQILLLVKIICVAIIAERWRGGNLAGAHHSKLFPDKLSACKGPGSAAHHFTLRCARDTSTDTRHCERSEAIQNGASG